MNVASVIGVPAMTFSNLLIERGWSYDEIETAKAFSMLAICILVVALLVVLNPPKPPSGDEPPMIY